MLEWVFVVGWATDWLVSCCGFYMLASSLAWSGSLSRIKSRFENA